MNARSYRLVLPSIFAIVLAGCGGGPDLSPQASEGREIARSSGCAACHGTEGQGGVGPAWAGLPGSRVELDDGTTVTADRDYLIQSIEDPQSQIVAGYTTKMPENDLSIDQIDAVIAYIDEISS